MVTIKTKLHLDVSQSTLEYFRQLVKENRDEYEIVEDELGIEETGQEELLDAAE